MKIATITIIGILVAVWCYKFLPVSLRICLAGFNVTPSPGLARSRVFINHWTGEKVTAYRKFTEKDKQEFAKYYPFDWNTTETKEEEQ